MPWFLAFFSFALLTTVPLERPSQDSCTIRMTENGNLVTLQGVVDAADWPTGTYNMTIETRQGGNLSLSRQGGAFDGSKQAADGSVVLSSTTVYINQGAFLDIKLIISDGARNTSCSMHYER